jgi:hypothetical protein
MLLDPTLQTGVAETFQIVKTSFRDQFKKIDPIISYEQLMSHLWYSTLPCFDIPGITAKTDGKKAILKYCKWKGLKIPCSDIFVAFPTDNGICCAFNIKSANEIFARNSYSEMISKFQKIDKKISFHSNSTSKNIDMTIQPGKNKGLMIVLDAHNDLVSAGTSKSDVDGFLGLVGSRGSFPFFGHEGFNIKPGHINYVGLSATRIQADDSLRNLDPLARNCRFSEESEMLKLHKTYSFANCMFECSFFNANQKMIENFGFDCIPWYFPPTNSSVVCDPWEAENFTSIMMNDLPNCDYCLADCTNTDYQPLITSAPFTHCSSRNLGVSSLCKLRDFSLPAPQLFGNDVVEDYESKNKYYIGFVPMAQTSKRTYGQSHDVFPNSAEYDALDVDTAIVEIYFRFSV